FGGDAGAVRPARPPVRRWQAAAAQSARSPGVPARVARGPGSGGRAARLRRARTPSQRRGGPPPRAGHGSADAVRGSAEAITPARLARRGRNGPLSPGNAGVAPARFATSAAALKLLA